MPLSSFNGANFQITFTDGMVVKQVPKWLDRNAVAVAGSLRRSITGRLSIQEIDQYWKPVTLEVSTGERPAAVMTQTMLDAFKSARAQKAGPWTLNLEGTLKTVFFDLSVGDPIQYQEITPTGEGDDFENQAGPAGRLYVGRIFFNEVLTQQIVYVAPLPVFADPFVPGVEIDGEVSTDVLNETGSMAASADADWWVNSGGRFIRTAGFGQTMQGVAPPGDIWRVAYNASSPTDTDSGTHPQNLFRLVGRRTFLNVQQQMYFRFNAYNVSASPNRNQSNGAFLWGRYQPGGQTVYYVGLRVDGYAVIKRKQSGDYTTLDDFQVIAGTYDIVTNPNLIETGKWYGLRAVVKTLASGDVLIQGWVDTGSGFVLAVQATDSAGQKISVSGFHGIRTDFADVDFQGYSVQQLP